MREHRVPAVTQSVSCCWSLPRRGSQWWYPMEKSWELLYYLIKDGMHLSVSDSRGTEWVLLYQSVVNVCVRHADTCMAWTSRLLSSRAAEAVDVPKEAAPRWIPRIMRPSFLYCSMGIQNRSLTPWTGGGFTMTAFNHSQQTSRNRIQKPKPSSVTLMAPRP